MPNDVFGLNTVYDRQVESTWPESNEYGYVAGGNPGILCTIERIDYSTETVAAPGNNLINSKYQAASFFNSNYGYICCGLDPSYTCTINRLDFSNETTSEPGLQWIETIAYNPSGGIQSLTHGYITGGYGPPIGGGPAAVYKCSINRLDFSTETVESPLTGQQLTAKKDNVTTIGSMDYGYICGGASPPTYTNTIDRLDFSSETVSLPGNNLSKLSIGGAPLYNENHGYFVDGYKTPPNVQTSEIERIDFSSETTSVLESKDRPRAYATAVSSSNYGFICGGDDGSPMNNIDRLDYSTETTSTAANNLITSRYYLSGVYSTKSKTHANQVKKGADIDGKGISSTYGYFAGGNFPGPTVAIIDRIDFSSHTVSAPSPSLTQARYGLAAVSNSNYGYFAGGFQSNWYATIDRLDFSNETVVGPPVHGVNLTQARAGLAAVSNSNYGFYAGGERFDFECTIDRLDFSNETLAVPSVGNELTKARQFLGAVSNSNYGYFGGGRTPPTVVTIDRIDFSSETVSLPGNNLTQARSGIAGVFSSNYGYFGGGSPSVCTIDRIDFSTETVDGPSVHGASLTQKRQGLAAVSGRQTRIRQTKDATNTNVGGYGFYYVGGYPGPDSPGQGNIVDYATETRTTKSELSSGYGAGSGFTTQQYGYHMGANTTVVKRYDFLNDTVNDNPALPSSVYGQGSSTSNYGYICNSNNTPNLDGNKYDFSAETLSIVPDMISVTRFGTGNGCFTSSRYVHFTGGPASPPSSGSNYTHMDRLEFATETRSPLNAGGPTKFQKNSVAGCRSNDYGYRMGGNPGYLNTVDKIEFENDTISDAGTFSPQGRTNGALAVSKNYGYFCMGLRVVGGPSPDWRRNRMDRYDFSTSTNVNPPTTFANKAIRGTCMPQDVAV